MTALRWFVVLLLVVGAGCTPAPDGCGVCKQVEIPVADSSVAENPPYVLVRFSSLPKGWGYAMKEAHPDGRIVGAHLSGGPTSVFVHESEDTMTLQDRERLLELLYSLKNETFTAPIEPDRKTREYWRLEIQYTPTRLITVYGSRDVPFEREEFMAICKILGKYQVGAW